EIFTGLEFRRVLFRSQAWEWATFIKGDYGALETKGGRILQFVDAETGQRAALADFAMELPGERVRHESNVGIWYEDEKVGTSYSLNEVLEGFKASPNILIRTEVLNGEGEKTLLDRGQSLDKIREATQVVEG